MLAYAASSVPHRIAVLKAARTWLGTPYHHEGMVKGAGVDCLKFVYSAYLEAGIIEPIVFEQYSQQWHLHQGDERYLEGLLQYGRETDSPQMADIVMYRWGRAYSHSALITEEGWPHIFHASPEIGCVCEDIGTYGRLTDRPRKFFTFWSN